MIEIIPNWHPIWVHFAVALLSTSALLFLIFGWRSAQASGRTNALIVARWTLRLGVFAAFGALITGYLASASVTHDDVSHANMMVHRNWALATTIIFAIAALIDSLVRTETRVFALSILLLLLLAGSATLAVTGLEGAENVYKYGLGVQKLPDVSTHEHSASASTSEHAHADGASDSHEDGAADHDMTKCGGQPMDNHGDNGESGEPNEDGTAGHDMTNCGGQTMDLREPDARGNELAEGVHDHDQPTVGATEVTTDGHGHGQSHEDAANVTAIDDSDHPASLVATQLADAIAMGDIDSLRAVVAADVVIFESGGIESSLTEYEGHHMPADMAFMKAMSREVISQQVIDSGDSATVVTRSRIHGTYKDKEIDLNSTETLVMRKLHGQWKVVHIHWSSS
jgi:uncharacterized membrane protein/ketosteroid isomerase-like protein